MVKRIKLTTDYDISRVLKGGWHLAGGHGTIDASEAIADMRFFVEAGITTFDCADIYTGVEELIGKFLKKKKMLSLLVVYQKSKYIRNMSPTITRLQHLPS